MLKVNRKTALCGNQLKDRPFWENVQIFCGTDIAPNSRFELPVYCLPRDLSLMTKDTQPIARQVDLENRRRLAPFEFLCQMVIVADLSCACAIDSSC